MNTPAEAEEEVCLVGLDEISRRGGQGGREGVGVK